MKVLCRIRCTNPLKPAIFEEICDFSTFCSYLALLRSHSMDPGKFSWPTVAKGSSFIYSDVFLPSLMFSNLTFGKHDLTPVKGVGMRGIVSDISLQASAMLSFKYIFFSDTTEFRIDANGMDFDMTLEVGKPVVQYNLRFSCYKNLNFIKEVSWKFWNFRKK